MPPPKVWILQQGQTHLQTSQEVLCLKHITITGKEFQFFYAMKANQEGSPDVLVISSSVPLGGASFAPRTQLRATLQSLGSLGEYEVGVIHASWLNQPGQIILLQITFPGRKAHWQLAPLKQVTDEPHMGKSRHELIANLTELPEVKWYGPVTKARVAFFSRRDAAGQPIPGISPVFLRMDDPMLVTTISQAEYLSLAGLRNFAP
jgi:hypothetical protein